jgi:SAM-dependent methyltransferase
MSIVLRDHFHMLKPWQARLLLMTVFNSTQRFSSRVDNYIRYRPGYPPEILSTLAAECGLNPESVIADIGSGTGLLTRMFLENGNRVYAVEPNAEMRQAGDRLLAGYSRFVSAAGTAENTTLPNHSVDFATAGQAAHWFNREKARDELVRILKPRGWAVLVWNERCTDTPFLEDYERLLLSYATDYQEVRHEHTTASIDSFFAPSAFQMRIFDNHQDFDYDSLQGRLLSSSYTPQADDPRFVPMLQELRNSFDRHNCAGRVRFEYKTRMYYGQVS